MDRFLVLKRDKETDTTKIIADVSTPEQANQIAFESVKGVKARRADGSVVSAYEEAMPCTKDELKEAYFGL